MERGSGGDASDRRVEEARPNSAIGADNSRYPRSITGWRSGLADAQGTTPLIDQTPQFCRAFCDKSAAIARSNQSFYLGREEIEV